MPCLGRHEEDVTLDRGSSLVPGDIDVWLNLTDVLYALSYAKEAPGHIEQSVDYQPERASILYRMGRIENAHGLLRELVKKMAKCSHILSRFGESVTLF